MRRRFSLQLVLTILLLAAIPLLVDASPGAALPEAIPTGNVPTSICYQGTLADSAGAPVNGPVNMTFAIYSEASGGSPVWTETQSVAVSRGAFSVYLGDSLPLTSAVFGGTTPLYLGVKVAADPEMTPRVRIGSVPYAFGAQSAPPCGGSMCSGQCVNLTADPLNCGTCGNQCTVANGAPGCSSSQCVVASCSAGFGNCNSQYVDGCETNLKTIQNCGACGNACSSPPNTSVSCPDGQCVTGSCNLGFGDCNNSLPDGCETDLKTSVTNCGSCGLACSFANAAASCANSTCFMGACVAPFGNCDGSSTNGCEANLQTSIINCGTCNHACTFPSGIASCLAGTCNLIGCFAGSADCDGNSANGCEVNLNNNPSHCGSCTTVCPTPLNATATCASSTCGFSCNVPFADCDKSVQNGCEMNLSNNVNNCGMCGMVCALPHASSTCTNSQCAVAVCNAGYANCDLVQSNGCEVAINTDRNHCGSCTNVCAIGQACVNGTCQ